MSGRSVFVIIAAAVAALVLFTSVVRPAVDRGGFAELAILGVVMSTVLLAERWLRGR